MHVIVDYRPALRARTGIGEYVHELARAFSALPQHAADTLTLFSSSWSDRLSPTLAAEIPTAATIDRRVPVRLLTWAWHRVGWPPIETLVGRCDVVHSPTPLLVPARGAAQVVTVFDLHFLHAPPPTGPQRDYADLVRRHVQRADHVVAGSAYAAGLVTGELGVSPQRVSATPLGAPPWAPDVRARRGTAPGNAIVFIGTLEPRKNLGVLLDAYAALVAARPDAPPLVLAGRATDAAAPWLARLETPPLAGRVQALGYVDDATRRRLYGDARVLVMPSVDEGFGLPVLEAMACGVPVVASAAGSLPEVLGDAGRLVDPHDAAAWAEAMAALLDDTTAREQSARGVARAEAFTWEATAAMTRRAYGAAVDARKERG